MSKFYEKMSDVELMLHREAVVSLLNKNPRQSLAKGLRKELSLIEAEKDKRKGA